MVWATTSLSSSLVTSPGRKAAAGDGRPVGCAISPTCRRFAAPVLGVLATLLAGAQLVAQQADSRTVKIPDGTPVPLYLKDDLSSKKNKENDPVRFQVREDVRVGGVVVIPSGTWASGRVTGVGGSGYGGQAGKLSFSVDSLKGPDGTAIPLRGAPTLKGGSNKSVAAAATAAYGLGALLMRGSHADIRKGTMLTAYVDGDRDVVITPLRLPTMAVNPPAPSPEPAPAPTDAATPTNPLKPAAEPVKSEEQGALLVKSNPEGAEILVNGKYAGNTPSTLRLPPGEYSIAVHKPGFVDWRRTMTLSANAQLTIEAPLQAGKTGLRLDQITDLLAGNVSQTRIARLVEERGITFPWSSDVERKLRAAGAEDTLIEFIRNTAESGTRNP